MPHFDGTSLSLAAAATSGDAADVIERLSEELRDSEFRYRRLFQTANYGILVLDAEAGQIRDVNPYLEGLLGYAHDELIGKALWELGAAPDAPAGRTAMDRVLAGELSSSGTMGFETKDGRRLQVEIVGTSCQYGGARAIQCTVFDVTSRKRVEEGVVRLIDDLLALVVDLRLREGPVRPPRA